MQKQNILAPLRPLLVHADVADDTKWVGGIDDMFMDDAKQYTLAFVLIEGQSVYYNKRLIPQGFNMKELFDPKWKGKMSMADPRGGAALVTLGAMMKLFGEEQVRFYLAKQESVITEQPRQQIDWMSSGRYPIAFGAPTAAFVEFEARGGRVEDFAFVTGGDYYTHGTGGAQYLDKAPHPAATKVFVNWLLMRDTQDKLMKANKLNSRRIDVPPGAPNRYIDPKDIGRYINGQSEEALNNQRKVSEIIKQVMK
jgi:ABC-type Fe3+ transport system substrate-binding protein